MLWGAFGTVLRMLLQIVSQVALARILGPEQFGLFALGLVVVVLSGYFADVGLAYGLIQKKTVSDADIRFVFTWQVALGAVVAVAIYQGSSFAADFYADSRLEPVLHWLSISCLVSALGSTAGSLLRRRLDFKSIQLAFIASYVVGFFGLGIPLALAGFGVYALIVAYLAQTLLASMIMLVKARHPIRPQFRHSEAGGILAFGATVLATNLVNWVMTGMDRVVVGRTMSIASAGLYSTVHNFITAPTVNALSVLQGVFYSASAQVQDSPRRLRRGFRSMFAVVGLFVTPVFFAMAAVAETLMLAIYGEKWAGAEIVFAPLAVAMPAFLLMGMAVPVLWASGNTRKEFLLQIPIALAWAALLVLVAQSGSLAWLSWCVCLLYYVRAAIIIRATCRAIRVPWRLLPRYLSAGVTLTVMVASSGWVADLALRGFLHSPHLRLAIVVLVCAVVMVGGIRLLRSRIRREVWLLVARVIERVPGGRPKRAIEWVMGK